jgi:putative spermidine/putrescine transport system substrate-binding protein
VDVRKKLGTLLVAGVTVASLSVVSIAANAGASSTNWAKVTHLSKSGPTSMTALIAAAKKEGKLNVIALPNNWANYGQIITSFAKKYHIKVNSINPQGSSGQEVTALQVDKGRANAPDVIDVGTNYAVTAQTDGLLAPYKVTTWSEIPNGLKQSAGYWFDDYGGFVAIGCNSAAVTTCPTSFAQMATLATKGTKYTIGLNNSPTTAAAALAGVLAAAVATGGSLDNVAPGVTYFANLNKAGTFFPGTASASTVENNSTNIVIWWDYLQASNLSNVLGSWKVNIPSDAAVGEFYSQGIAKAAPNPAAARLWEEYLYSPAGQNLWLKGLARPVELAYMQAHGTANKAWVAKLPGVPKGTTLQYPSITQLTNAATYVDANWAAMVGAG